MLAMIDRNLERYALIYFYSFLVIVMANEVLRREVLSYSSIWGEEMVRYSFIYLVWIAAAAAVKDRAHIRIDVIFNYLGNKGKILLYMLGDIVMFGVAIFCLFLSIETVKVSWEFGSVSHGLRVSLVWFLLAVPIGFSLMMIRLVQSFMRDLSDFRENKPAFVGEKMFD